MNGRGRAARPGCRVHPERAVGRNAVEDHVGLGKTRLDFLGRHKAFVRLEHVIGRLRAGCTGFFRVVEEMLETLGAVLSAFNAGMKDSLSHR